MASTPGLVAGTFTSRLARSTRLTHWRASAIVASASWASPGLTSTETKPSPPSLHSQTGRRMSQASAISVVTRLARISLASWPALANSRSGPVVVGALGDGGGKDRRVGGDSADRRLR